MDCDFEKEVNKGFQSVLVFKCRVCNKVTELDTDKRGDGDMGVNDAMVTGALAGGGGYATLSELSGAVDMPCMAQSTYIVHERSVGRAVEAAMLDSMLDCGKHC